MANIRIKQTVQRRPWRLRLARAICQPLPPVLGFRLAWLLYPREVAKADSYVYQHRVCTGSLFCGNTSEMHSYYLGIYGYSEWRNLAVALALCKPGDTILEIGANIGTETVGFRDIVGSNGRVIAFEPVPANYIALEQLVNLNRWKNVEIRRFALGANSGVVHFELPADPLRTGIGHIACSGDGQSGHFIEVDCTTLDHLAHEVGPARLVVIDAEGSDAEIVEGGRHYIKRHQPALVVEAASSLLSRAGWTIERFFEVLQSYGYNVYRLARYGCIPIRKARQAGRTNWLCLHKSEPALVHQVNRSIRKCALFPCIPVLNPLRSVSTH